MCDNFLKRQIKNFKRRQDQAMADLNCPVLFQRPDVMTQIYSARPLEDEQFHQGEKLYAIASPGGIDLVRGCERVGQLVGESADGLRVAMSDGCSTLAVCVESVSEVSQRGKVIIVKE